MKPTIAALLIMRSSDLPALVEKVSSLHRWIAIAYIGSLLLAALFSYLLWSSGNRVQDALRAESEARIADADAKIAKVKADGEAAIREADEKILRSGEKIADLNRQSEAHKAEAESARREIATGKAEAARANEAAARANGEAAKANERAGALELETAQQREKAAIAEKALLELQQRVQDRHLTAEQRQALRDLLTTRPKGEITLFCVGGDPEPCAFAGELAEVLRASGWTVLFGESEHGLLFLGGSPKGIFLRVHSGNTPRAVALQEALKAVGIDALGELRTDAPDDWVNLLVGYKP
jgi:hypothetical protein